MLCIHCHLEICSIKLPSPQKNANGENEYTYKIQATETVGSHGYSLLSQDKSMYVYFSFLKNLPQVTHSRVL